MNTGKCMSGHQSAKMKNDEWLTPLALLNALGRFDLDPCAPSKRPWPTAAHHMTKTFDGLKQKWYGRIWLNPPFGSQWPQWVRKLADHGNGIALIAARTETRAFFDLIWNRADAVCFLRGRPHFHFVDGKRAPFNSGAPICLAAFGSINAKALADSGLGKTIPLRVLKG